MRVTVKWEIDKRKASLLQYKILPLKWISLLSVTTVCVDFEKMVTVSGKPFAEFSTKKLLFEAFLSTEAISNICKSQSICSILLIIYHHKVVKSRISSGCARANMGPTLKLKTSLANGTCCYKYRKHLSQNRMCSRSKVLWGLCIPQVKLIGTKSMSYPNFYHLR